VRIVSPKGTLRFGPNVTCRNAAFISLTARTRWFRAQGKVSRFRFQNTWFEFKNTLVYLHSLSDLMQSIALFHAF